MLFTALKSVNAVVFTILSGLHFYWAFAGLFGAKARLMAATVPQINGKPLFRPSFWATVMIAVALLVCAFLSVWAMRPIYEGASPGFVSDRWCVCGNLSIGIVFLLRAVGDFRYVGFFKKVTGTAFARNDTFLYSPLCLLVSMVAFCIYFYIRY